MSHPGKRGSGARQEPSLDPGAAGQPLLLGPGTLRGGKAGDPVLVVWSCVQPLLPW